MYERKPCGRLGTMQRDEHTLTVSNAGPVERVVVWTEKRLAHCLLEREAWDRAQLRGDSELQPGAEKPPEYVLGGALLDETLLDRRQHGKPSQAATDPQLLSRSYGTTDRARKPVTCAQIDVNTNLPFPTFLHFYPRTLV